MVLVDDAQKLFYVDGPITDDTFWTNRVVELQREGRIVHCTTEPVTRSMDDVIAHWRGQGYELSPRSSW